MTFQGFPRGTIEFLLELADNNNRSWFEENRKRYEKDVKAPAFACIESLGAALARVRPDIQAIPKVNGSLFRLNRDTRFAKNKDPYKTHIGILLWEGNRKRMENSGFYFHVEPGLFLLGAGLYMLPRELFQPYREAVDSGKLGPRLAEISEQLETAGYEVGTEQYKRVPKGFPADHPRARFLKFNGLAAMVQMDLPEEIHGPEIIDMAVHHFMEMVPIHQWILDALG